MSSDKLIRTNAKVNKRNINDAVKVGGNSSIGTYPELNFKRMKAEESIVVEPKEHNSVMDMHSNSINLNEDSIFLMKEG
jgi:hypothetical protein